MNKEFRIGKHSIGPEHEPFLIAELSGNHNQSLDRALAIVDAAAAAGAHALKLQTYTADTMTLDLGSGDFFISDEKSLWKGQSLHQLYQQAHTPWEWHKPIFDRCHEHGMVAFSTPFDETAVDFLEKLNVPCYKIASFENTCFPLMKKIASTKKPIIMSTGMATLAEIEESVAYLNTLGVENLILLKCTSSYPTPASDAHIKSIPFLAEKFDCLAGLSDHTMGCGVAIASVALGAVMVEKHFTLNRADGGVDSSFSMEPEEFKLMTVESKKAWEGLGKVQFASKIEEKSRIFRRSIYVTADIKSGEPLSESNIRWIRPGFGLEPKYWDHVLGKRVKRDLARGTALKKEDIDF